MFRMILLVGIFCSVSAQANCERLNTLEDKINCEQVVFNLGFKERYEEARESYLRARLKANIAYEALTTPPQQPPEINQILNLPIQPITTEPEIDPIIHEVDPSIHIESIIGSGRHARAIVFNDGKRLTLVEGSSIQGWHVNQLLYNEIMLKKNNRIIRFSVSE